MKGILKGLVAVVISLGLSVSSANAADCKGMSSSACSSNSSCSWVDSYKRKDGASVNGYCRTAKVKTSLEKAASSKTKSVKESSSSATDKLKAKTKSATDKMSSSTSEMKKMSTSEAAKAKQEAEALKKSKLN